MALSILRRVIDPRQEISQKLEKCHLAYLCTDESPLKLQQRQKLEGVIREYLHVVPHENKYVFSETAHILRESAEKVKDFSCYRACSAWSAISIYASNLLAQPWRKEYRTLRTYSGYYKHEVEANLSNTELMFQLMGYKYTELGVLTLDGPIDPDRVKEVSRDAIVAFVECEIMKQIWENLCASYTISWIDILQFREHNAGTPEQATRALTQYLWERQHHPEIVNYHDSHCLQPTDANIMPPATVPYQVITDNCKTGIAVDAHYVHRDAMNSRHFYTVESSPMSRCNTYGYMPQIDIHPSTPTYFDPYSMNNSATYTSRVQPDRLSGFDSVPTSVINHEKSSHHYRDPTSSKYHDDCNIVERKNIKTSTSLDIAPHESWDYVYKSLPNRRYSEDFDDRSDISRKNDSVKSQSSKTNQREYDDKYSRQYNQTRYGKSREIRGETIGDIVTVNGSELLKNKSSVDILDSRSSNDHTDIKSANIQDKIKKFNSTLVNQLKNHETNVDSLKNISIQSTREKLKNDGWNCSVCTYFNKSTVHICEMCGKSKCKGNEDIPLASGGKQCPNCTLVNERDALKCDACERSLEDSPTYI